MLYKNLPERELRHVMFVRWILDYVAAWNTLLINGNVGDFKAIYKARHSFRKWRKDFDKDRDKILSSAILYDIPERRKFSILWQYYLKSRKVFSALEE